MRFPRRGEEYPRLPQVLKDCDALRAGCELVVHLEEYDAKAVHICFVVIAGSPPSRLLNLRRDVQARSDLYNTTQLVIHQYPRTPPRYSPSVMSPSKVTTLGAQSEGSTAAKLDVARPKSPTLQSPWASMKMFVSLISRWRIPRLAMCTRASIIWWKSLQPSSSEMPSSTRYELIVNTTRGLFQTRSLSYLFQRLPLNEFLQLAFT